MRFNNRPSQLAFPRTRQQFKWRRFKRAVRRFIESEWFNMAVVLLIVAFAVGYFSVAS